MLGIREYDNSFWLTEENFSLGLHVHCDPWWEPYGAPRTNEPGRGSFSPPFPAYPSGHATFGAAAFEMTRLFFGFGFNQPDTIEVNFVSDEMDGRAIADDGSFRGRHRRHHPSLLRAMFDNAVSRVYLGVHWRFDGLANGVQSAAGILADGTMTGGVPLGRVLARDIFQARMTRSTAPRASVVPINLPKVP